MINKDTYADEYAADLLFAVSDEEILEAVSSSDITQEAESGRERVFRQIAERTGIHDVCVDCTPFPSKLLRES